MAGWLHGVFVGDWLFVFPLSLQGYAMTRKKSSSRKAQLKRERKEQLKDNLDNPDFIVGVMEDISEDRIAV